MNKMMLTGVIAGVGIAVAGGVVGLTSKNGPVEADEVAVTEGVDGSVAGNVAATPAAPRSAPVQAAAPAPEVVEECWDEEVVVQTQPRDDKAIAGTAAGALIGGALADRLGDDDDLVTAAGAAAGAFIGRKAQREYQENQTETVIERRCAPVSTR